MSSYIRRCNVCGQRIHMREMPAGHWLAFDFDDEVHQHWSNGPEPIITVHKSSPGVRPRKAQASRRPSVLSPNYRRLSAQEPEREPYVVPLWMIVLAGVLVIIGLFIWV
jgi:hypothetical protein